MTLIDTHVLLWLGEENPRLGRRTRRRIDTALHAEELAISALSFWEIGMLLAKGRIALSQPVEAYRRDALGSGIEEIPVNGAIGILASQLDGLHADPADRIIAATAIRAGGELITADTHLLHWRGALRSRDATR